MRIIGMKSLLELNPTLQTLTESANTIPVIIPILDKRLK
jgi:hypothetical protein